jgi:hypothetical protein
MTEHLWWVYGMLRGTPGGSDHVPVASKTSALHRPHYSDRRFQSGKEHTLYGRQEPGLHYVYSDRIWQWDYAKAERASAAATEAHGPIVSTPQWYETYLSAYFGIPLDLAHIIGGVNVSSGYEYYAFGYRERAALKGDS